MELSSSFCGCVRNDIVKSSIHTAEAFSPGAVATHKIRLAAGGPRRNSDKESSSTPPGNVPATLRRSRKHDDHLSVPESGHGTSKDRFPFHFPEFDPDPSTNLFKALRAEPSLAKSRLGKYVTAVRQVWTTKDLPSAVCAAVESVITLVEPVEWASNADPVLQLAGNFAPVPEFPPSGFCLEVEGTIPEALNGVYVRNGANPQFMPTGGYHQFDGDGMLHAVRIREGQASYCCRYVQTHRFLEEAKAGMPLIPKALGELCGTSGISRLALFSMRKALGVISPERDGIGTANAGLAFHNGRLLAMSEDDKPYAVHILDNGDIRTQGRLDFDGKLSAAMTAHPKVDPSTGELFAYGYNVLLQPYLTYFRVSPSGKMTTVVPINRQKPILQHDFVITEKYAVFPEPQIVFRLDRMILNRESLILTDESMVPQIGILPKYDRDASRMKWFDMPEGSSCFHFLNGWDEGDDEVVLVGSSLTPLKHLFNDPTKLVGIPTEYRLNLTTGKLSKKPLTTMNCDVGGINGLYASRKNRYFYLSTYGPWPKFAGVVKIDAEADNEERVVARRDYGAGCYGSEPFFVPRSDEPHLAEDDGYLITYIHDENADISKFIVMDARSPSLEIVASVKLPGRVPYGFHGIFLKEQQLSRQNTTPIDANAQLLSKWKW